MTDTNPVPDLCRAIVGGTPGDPGGTLSYCGLPEGALSADGTARVHRDAFGYCSDCEISHHAFVPASPAFPEPPEITRVEVIDDTGRAYQAYGVVVTTDVQDDGRTLKVFVYAPALPVEHVLRVCRPCRLVPPHRREPVSNDTPEREAEIAAIRARVADPPGYDLVDIYVEDVTRLLDALDRERAALKELREAIGRLTCEDCGKLLSDREWSGCIVCQSDRALLHPEDASG